MHHAIECIPDFRYGETVTVHTGYFLVHDMSPSGRCVWTAMENHVLGRRTRALWTCPVLFRARSSSLGTWPLQRVRELACLPLCAGRAWYRSRLSISNTLPANTTCPVFALGIDGRKGCIHDASKLRVLFIRLRRHSPCLRQRQQDWGTEVLGTSNC